MEKDIDTYLDGLLAPKEAWIERLEARAKEDRVPIMESAAIDYMLKQIQIHQPKTILEIGTAIGYSALRILHARPGAEIISIEKDEGRYQEASQTIETHEKQKRIHLIHGDALEAMEKLRQEKKTFDFIFMDAAKGKYQDFFELADPLFAKGGWLFTDNVLFRGYVVQPEHTPKRYRKMVDKIRKFNESMSANPDYITSILPIGDGLMASYKKK
jgi:predicted O-methyltransferase YrrM